MGAKRKTAKVLKFKSTTFRFQTDKPNKANTPKPSFLTPSQAKAYVENLRKQFDRDSIVKELERED